MPKATFHQQALVHDIDFAIYGDDMQYVEIELDPGEATIAEAGAMMYMDNPITMETIFGEGTQSGVVDHLLGAGKRLLTGENLFMTAFSNSGVAKHRVAFAAPYPGKIIPINLAELGGEIICQKEGFLCAAKGVSIDIVFQKRIGVGLFGGEGFIMQSLKGDGLAFVHAGGSIHNIELTAGQSIKVDTGCLVALEKTVHYDVEFVGGVKSALFGGEGFFFANLTGPGNIWLQSMPFSRLAGKLHSAMPKQLGGGAQVGEGSLIDSLGVVGDLLNRR
nr:TIGR00266 family protein [Oceanicoccus sagamiensis]